MSVLSHSYNQLAKRFLAFTVVVSQNNHLEDAKGAASEVEEDIAYTPAHGALSRVIHVELRGIPAANTKDEQLLSRIGFSNILLRTKSLVLT
jgi:hypothetical protein